MVSRLLLALAITLFTGQSVSAQLDSSFGDTGQVGGTFISAGTNYFQQNCDDGFAYQGCNDACAPRCGGPYLSIFGGIGQLRDQNSNGFGRNLEIGFDDGVCVGAAFGKRITRNFRSEFEYTFRHNEADSTVFNSNPINTVSGDTNSNSGMINAYFDLPMGVLVPYAGMGLGVTSIDSDVRYGNGGATLNGNDTSLAFQWMAGITVRSFQNAELFCEYRYFEANDPKLNRFGGPPINGVVPNLILESEYVSRDVNFGIRLNF